MHYYYKTKGTCSKEIEFDIKSGRLYNVKFMGGCNGNLKAISSLVEGLLIEEVETRCKGIKCGSKNTSCADQLVCAIEEAKQKVENHKSM